MMATMPTFTIKIHQSSWLEFQLQIEEAFVGNVRANVMAYLDTVPADRREVVEREMAGFIEWIRATKGVGESKSLQPCRP